jgi:hypothetical protein
MQSAARQIPSTSLTAGSSQAQDDPIISWEKIQTEPPVQLTCQPLFATMAVNSKGFPLWALSLLAIPRFCRREGGVDFLTGIIRQVPFERASEVNRGEDLGISNGDGKHPAYPGRTFLNLPPTSVICRNACSLLGRVPTR